MFPAPNEDPNPRCDKCEGGNKNAPVIGLVVLSGQILDPDNGNVYRSKVGRSQTWVRQE